MVDPKTYRQRYAEHVHKVGVPFWPDAGWKDVVFALAVGSIVLVLAVWLGPPELGGKADPTVVEAYPRPDWYFLWYFALLALIPPNIEDVFIIGFPLLIGLLFLMLPFVAPAGERSPRRRPWAVGIVGLFGVSVAALVQVGLNAPWSPDLGNLMLPQRVTQGLSPTALQGARVFEQKGCINCHRLGGVGGQRGPDLSQVGSRLSTDALTWRILNGGRNMPAYGSSLSPADVSALLEFLASRQ
jgi:ubiquinol-cytochrome c reductase cytochrome b subunit